MVTSVYNSLSYALLNVLVFINGEYYLREICKVEKNKNAVEMIQDFYGQGNKMRLLLAENFLFSLFHHL